MVDNVPDRPERRRYPRIKAKVSVELLVPGAAPTRTSTDEISLCGCYIETMFTMEVGTKIAVVLSVKGQNVRAQGIVVTKYPQVGNGIDFVELNQDDRRKLSEFISEHQHDDNASCDGTLE
jgi:c-di-GMP-binding flagellar brake protein YcgR